MIIHRLRSFDEYTRHRERMQPVFQARADIELALQRPHKAAFAVRGFSYPAREMVEFQADFAHSHNGVVNWREWLICPVTGLNNRTRAAVHLLDSELGTTPDEHVYVTEQVTSLHRFLATRYPRLTGSEYLGAAIPRGHCDRRGVRNEDLTCLSFPDRSYDVVMSFDCLEHVPEATAAFREIVRILRPGGRLLWTVPFRSDLEANLVRATVAADGTVVHHHPAEYHEDPLDPRGCLCYTHFGWEMLRQVRAAGFRDAYALTYWSDVFGYLGVEQCAFVAVT